jgi:hypothetical protein
MVIQSPVDEIVRTAYNDAFLSLVLPGLKSIFADSNAELQIESKHTKIIEMGYYSDTDICPISILAYSFISSVRDIVGFVIHEYDKLDPNILIITTWCGDCTVSMRFKRVIR